MDTEYNRSKEARMNVLCASVYDGERTDNFWFENGQAHHFLSRLQSPVICSYAVTAEARALISLGINPLQFKWVDLYLEYRCLTNHNHRLMYGKQLIKGKEKVTYPPKNKWDMTEEELEQSKSQKPEHGLGAAVYKLLGIKIDTEEKSRMRELIISCPESFTEEEKRQIMDYCASDVKYLPQLFTAMVKEYRYLFRNKPEYLKTLKEDMFTRGEYAVRTAIMETIGYPIDVTKTQNFSHSVGDILRKCQKEINSYFPEIMPFKVDNKLKYTWDQNATRLWINKQKHKNWLLTETKKPSLSLEAFEKFYNFSHSYPTDSFGAQMVRFLKLKQQLNGFSPNAKEGSSFWDYVGSDGYARAYFGIYGAQSSRSQPKATGFLFLKSAWMRALCVPPKGMAIAGIDFKSQEFLIQALLSGDKNMLDAYHSGDPYFHTAKLAGAVPMDAKRKDHEDIRNAFKSTTLGLSYDMTEHGLAVKLTNDLGRPVSTDEALKLINLFFKAYSVYKKWKEKIPAQYARDRMIRLADGWMMWGDNANHRSVGNIPIQGMGAVIMRKAVALAQDHGLKVILTLHDALYILYDSHDFEAIRVLADCMTKSFAMCFPNHPAKDKSIGLDIFSWSQDYPRDTGTTYKGLDIYTSNLYVDSRSLEEYKTFSPYFEREEFNL